MTVQPEAGAIERECFPNVEAKIARVGGRMVCGWQLWEWPHVMVEAEFHAVWLSPEGHMVDITLKPHGETTVLFVPDDRRRPTGATVDNVRLPTRDDQLIRHFIRVSEMKTGVMNRGVPAAEPGRISVPLQEIEPLDQSTGISGARATVRPARSSVVPVRQRGQVQALPRAAVRTDPWLVAKSRYVLIDRTRCDSSITGAPVDMFR